ncbi:hypothetical protein [Lacticaseibacillus hulanensis]|uniref:hypothetical protein n=1 Tax=Lacticaseibacillus hulanensis TaxID=2493111 RepID=UPI000FD9F48D|nr:hypothetical protein [Lacticaseibacillus hulanensis]
MDINFRVTLYQGLWFAIVAGIFALLIAATYIYRKAAFQFPMALDNIILNYVPGALAAFLGYFVSRTQVRSGRALLVGGTLWTMLMAYLMFFH